MVTPLHHHPPGSPDYDEFGYGQASPLRTQQQQQQQQASSPQRGFAPPAPRGFGPGPEDSAEAYYPQQVALRVAAPRRPVSPVEQTSIVRLSDGGSSSSPPSHSPPPQLPVAALHRLPSHPCEVPDVVVRGVQGTTGRGAAAAQPPYPSLAAAAPVVDPDDPWSRLQTQYRIDSVPAGAPLPRAGYMLAASPLPAPRAVPAAAPAQQQQQRKGMLVLGDDDAGYDTGLYGVPGGRGGQDRAPKAPAPAAAVKPKQGGWGNGNLASAGTLMLGQEDWAAAAEQRQHDQQQQQQQYQQLPAADAYAHAHAHAPRGPAGMGDPKQSMDDLDEMYREVVTNERQPPAAVTKSKVVVSRPRHPAQRASCVWVCCWWVGGGGGERRGRRVGNEHRPGQAPQGVGAGRVIGRRP